MRARRMSHDEKSVTGPRRFLIDVEETIRVVLEQEDTDGDFQISITDAGPKMMALGTATSNGFKTFDIRVSCKLTISYHSNDIFHFHLGNLHALQSIAGACPSQGSWT